MSPGSHGEQRRGVERRRSSAEVHSASAPRAQRADRLGAAVHRVQIATVSSSPARATRAPVESARRNRRRPAARAPGRRQSPAGRGRRGRAIPRARAERIDDQHGPPRRHPRGFGDRVRRRLGIMQDLVEDYAVEAGVGERQRSDVALEQARVHARGFELDPRQAQHLGERSSRGLTGPRAEHSTIRPVPVPTSTTGRAAGRSSTRERVLDLAFGDVKRAERVPRAGMGGEIAGGGLGPSLADSFQAGGISCGNARVTPSPSRRAGHTGGRPARVDPRQNTQPPSRRRSTIPASARIAYGAKPAAGSGRALARARRPTLHIAQQGDDSQAVGSASAWKISASGRLSESRHNDIKISLYGQSAAGADFADLSGGCR